MTKTYCKPLKRGASWRSQNFGDSSTVYGPHSGADEACPVGTPVHAAGDGVIEWAGEFDNSYADNMFWLLDMGGNVAVLNCGDDEPTFIYAHLSTFYVRPGDRVKKGQVIALSGNSGYATTGPHLHVEAVPPGYVLNSYLLGRVNPDTYLTEYPEDIITPHAATIEEVEDMSSFTEQDRAVLNSANIRAEIAMNEATNSKNNGIAILSVLEKLSPALAAEIAREVAKLEAKDIAANLKIVVGEK